MNNVQGVKVKRAHGLKAPRGRESDQPHLRQQPRHALTLLLLAAATWSVLGFAFHAPNAPALPILWQKCPLGSGAGNCQGGLLGVAADPDTGSVYAADSGNDRINEFSPWGVFLKSWGWGVATGAAKLETCGPAATPPTQTCQAGIGGTGSGQLSTPSGLTLDSAGNVYVYESKPTFRVQKFGSDGSFILMFGKEVNLTNVAERESQEAAAEPVTVSTDEENVCTKASGDTCGAGDKGSEPGAFGRPPGIEDPDSAFIASTPADDIQVGDYERIQIFDSNGHYKSSISLPGKAVGALTVDREGNTYVSYLRNPAGGEWFNDDWMESDVHKLGPDGNEICPVAVRDPRALTTDAQGRLYVAAGMGQTFENPRVIRRFFPGCVEDKAFAFELTGLRFDDSPRAIATSEACGIEGNLYYTNYLYYNVFLRAYYPAPDTSLCPPPPADPTITDQYASEVTSTSAVVRAAINPHFWGDMTYYVEYGTEDCASGPSACDLVAVFPGAHLKGEADEPLITQGVFLDGLEPDTTYHYRFVAQSGGGGPVSGIGAAEEDSTFTTFPSAAAQKTNCPNQGFRLGPSAALPDCRAYEMVSPVDKDGGDIAALRTDTGDRAWLNVSAGSGDRFTYSSYRAFGNVVSGPYASQYLASRSPQGWSSEGISPYQEGIASLEGGSYLDVAYKAFDEELCTGWLRQATEPLLAPGAISGYANLYRRQNCGAVGFEALTPTAPTQDSSKGEEPFMPKAFTPELEGVSADGSHAIFVARGNLTGDATACQASAAESSGCVRQLYDSHNGELDLVCVLPNEQPSDQECWAGSNGLVPTGRHHILQHAISDDGSRIFWGSNLEGNNSIQVGKLYVRINNLETLTITNLPSRFVAASPDGTRVIYGVYPSASSVFSSKHDLYEAEVDGGEKTRIAREVVGVLGVSEDTRRLYFASTEVLTGEEENSEGKTAEAGKPNLYFYEAGEDGGVVYIATLLGGDVDSIPAALNPSVFYKSSRVTPDGMHAAFTSLAPLTGTDNVDARTGKAVTEVFFYDAVGRKLRCVSCSATNARPRGVEDRTLNSEFVFGGVLPGWANQMQRTRLLSDDGRRLFFESFEPLVLADTNGKRDVYEWEVGDSPQECAEVGAQLYLRQEGGCLSLISSGESLGDSSFLDAGKSGRDVFFLTSSSLISQDPGLVDVYDAREGGGFAAPVSPAPACEGEACQGAYSPPQDPVPASSIYQGAGNVDERNATQKKKKKKKHSRHKKKHHKKNKRGGGASHSKGGHR
ncbi:MAG TPA: hypothetical protein VNM38_07170 [Solirubrobacterales bacterium]|nr:hypothetical protein [Solirubrobacterales bacterium]